jgi:RNA polymerase sigma factor (sigma-70 family)
LIAPAANSALLVGTEYSSESAAPATDDAVRVFTSRLASGNEAAWTEFHARYFDRLLRYMLVLNRGDEQASRDALQVAFTRIVRHMRQFDNENALWGWLAVVARSCVVDESRRHSRYRALLERYALGFVRVPSNPVDEPLPRLLETCLGELPDDDRALLAAKYHDRVSIADLATRANCSAKAIESRLARLRGALKTRLLKMLHHEN